MRMLAFNSSPRKTKSNTNRILLPFIEGAKEAGADVDLVYLYDRNIKPCLGCYNCWLKTPGQCCQKDDMEELLPAMTGADVIVYATPLYVFGMTAQMKLLLDRIIPSAEPYIDLTDAGHCTHPSRYEKKEKGMVVVSNCGFHELDNFDEMMAHFRIICRHSRTRLMGALLRPEGEFLGMAEKLMPEKAEAIYAAAREAGRQVVRDGRIAKETEQAVAAQLLTREQFVEGANAYFRAAIERATKRTA
jgi:multimeric flavodoxin WrbA